MTASPFSLGIAAGLSASAIWGGTLAVTRLGVSAGAPFGPTDIAMLRFVGPALLLLPVLRRAWPRLRQVPPWQLAVLLIGGGAPFVVVAGAGLSMAGAAEAGALLPGTVPLCVALFSAVLGERFGIRRLVGLMLIGGAVAAVLVPALGDGVERRWEGYVLLLAAAMMSAGYTLALRRSGIGPWEAAAFVSLGSLIMLGPACLFGEARVFTAPMASVLVQAGYQGLASGVVAPVAFVVAVRLLGPSRAAAFGSLSPGVACAGGFALLGEVPDALTSVAVAASALGVGLVARPAAALGEKDSAAKAGRVA